MIKLLYILIISVQNCLIIPIIKNIHNNYFILYLKSPIMLFLIFSRKQNKCLIILKRKKKKKKDIQCHIHDSFHLTTLHNITSQKKKKNWNFIV